ncbi:caspase, EACC1-associated type [Streptosporangium sp. V21-05]|uniref:caspase, EACC1-associated type n=1 Tax=Streptosporangium sp. V21-05 TaxID=3446115 RepID=UPI003F5358C4
MPSPDGSRAVLIGTHSGCGDLGLADLPSVKRNLTELRRLLTDGTAWALAPEHCVSIPQPESSKEVLWLVEKAALETTDTLLVYYCGHGLLAGRDEELFLALSGARWADECLRYEALRTRLREAGRRASRTVVILDCCFSGRALPGRLGETVLPQEMIERAVRLKSDIKGACILTAAAATRKALAPKDDDFSAFTGELIEVLRHGIPGGAEFLDMTAIYGEVAERLARRPGVPEPQFGTWEHGGGIVLTRNNAFPRPPGAAEKRPRDDASADTWRHRVRREYKDPLAVSMAVFLGSVGGATIYGSSKTAATGLAVGVLTFVVMYGVRLLLAVTLSGKPYVPPEPVPETVNP